MPTTKKKPALDPRYIYSEADLSKYLDIPKSIFKEIRNRVRKPFPKSEYATKQGMSVHYTEAGFELMCKLIGIPPQDAKKLIEEKQQIERDEPITWGIVASLNFVNQHIVMAELTDDTRIRVRVGPSGNGNFITGMPIPIMHIEGDTGRLARKNPKSKGIW
jgi:hypothetical protein